jgi:2-dehydro-3-deoxygalactonokinase
MSLPAATVHGDWGSTRLRLFLVRNGTVVDRRSGPGIGALPKPPASVLDAELAPWRVTHAIGRVTLCGMAGSRNGLAEARYADCPCDEAGWAASCTRLESAGTPVMIAPGLACTNRNRAPDVMRGEETQIFGALARAPALAHGRQMLVLPGTHSKWAEIEGGTVRRFHTFFTGELFALLRDRSALTTADPRPEGADEGFSAGLARGGQNLLLGALFEARSAQLRLGRSGGWATGFLSGLLIGRELGEALALHDGDPSPVTIIGASALSCLYAQAFAARDVNVAMLDGDDCALAGLAALDRYLTQETAP